MTSQSTVDVSWSATLATGSISAAITRDGSWTVTGVDSATASFSGDGTFMFDATLRSTFRANASAMLAFDATATYNAAQMSTATHQAIGGSISYDLHATDTTTTGTTNTSATFEIQAELTFAADGTGSLTLDGDQHYTLDTATGVVVRASVN